MSDLLWTTKRGAVGRPLILSLSVNDDLVDFGDLVSPELRMRPQALSSPIVTLDVVEFSDSERPEFNAQVIIEDWSLIEAGTYLAEIAAEFQGQQVRWPDDRYLMIKVLRGLV